MEGRAGISRLCFVLRHAEHGFVADLPPSEGHRRGDEHEGTDHQRKLGQRVRFGRRGLQPAIGTEVGPDGPERPDHQAEQAAIVAW